MRYLFSAQSINEPRRCARAFQGRPTSVLAAIFLGVLLLLGHASPAWSAVPCSPVVGRLASVQGDIEVQRSSATHWRPARLNEAVCQGDSVRAGEHSRAELQLVNEAVLRLDQNSVVRLTDIVTAPKKRSFFSLVRGALQSFSRHPRHFTINTPYLNGSIEGTEFAFRVGHDRTTLTVFEGVVVAANRHGSVRVTRGHAAVAQKGQAPQLRTVVHPRNASEWTMYYPPVLALGVPSAPTFQSLRTVPPAARNADYYLKRAALLLSVGQVNEARADIDRALRMNPKAGLAYALRSVIEVVANERTKALNDARHAVALSPRSAAARIALSYAQQAKFEIKAARDTMRIATAQHPKDALALSRLAELELMLGNRAGALADARKAAVIEPQLSRTQVTLGFAALADFHRKQARAVFKKAVVLDSADPLAHFGLGLSEISLGQLKKGTGDIEVAVGLDGRNALFRAYLGKAYFAEKRGPLAAQQFQISEQLDPRDPTAYLYGGIQKQTDNNPVGALRDVQKSIALNGDRAVYRSRLLLDKDRAARGTSLSRVYRDLGFAQLGVNEAAQSLSIDPANASAHRFLSDTYQGIRRRGIARLSDLLQAQMLQTVNIDPLQPSISQANLNIVTLGGPANAGFNEFTSLFDSNQAKVDVAGFGGTQDTRSGELVASGLYGPYSLSAGAFSYQTDGWRPNNALNEHVQNIFTQVAITDSLNVQAEFQHLTSRAGDLAFNFDPNNFDPTENVQRRVSTARFGLRYTPTVHSTFLVSYIHNNAIGTKVTDQFLAPDPFYHISPTLAQTEKDADNGDQVGVQYILQHHWRNFVLGASMNNTKIQNNTNIQITHPIFGLLYHSQSLLKQQVTDPKAYAYAYIKTARSVTWTLGASYQDYQEGGLTVSSFNPKLGVQWQITKGVRLRAAAFQVVKPALANDRTLEPTQIAGFNQFFDDINGTKSRRYAFGVDWQVNPDVATGAEFTWRKLSQPVYDGTTSSWLSGTHHEQKHRLYLYWTPSARVAMRTNLTYDLFTAQPGYETQFGNLPERVKTISLPIGVRYFASTGWFAGASWTFVHQRVVRAATSTQGSGSNSFALVDAAIGYRLPRRLGIVSIGVKNLFDRTFRYQDDSYREFGTQPSIGPYFPTRTIFARLAVSL